MTGSFESLSRLGRVRRMRGLARAALDAFGLPHAGFHLLREAGNTLFRVYDTAPEPGIVPEPGAPVVFLPGQYLLRIHEPHYQETDAIELELSWLAALRRDARLPVPEPVPNRDGGLLAQVSLPGIPEPRSCSLLRWVDGRAVTRGAGPHHYRAQGRLMAALHDHAAHWQPPAGLTKRRYDWEGLFAADAGTGMPASAAWELLPREYVQPFEAVSCSVKQVMAAWGEGPGVFGLIHADLGIDANVLFRRGEARAIDFDDSGFGYYPYDLALALEHCQEDPALPRYRAALLDGYTEVRPLPPEQVQSLDLFLAAFWVYLSLWAAALAHRRPQYRDVLAARMARAFSLVQRFLASA